ncbi:MAG: S26 family signal peptidase [Halobacteriales archaeon]
MSDDGRSPPTDQDADGASGIRGGDSGADGRPVDQDGSRSSARGDAGAGDGGSDGGAGDGGSDGGAGGGRDWDGPDRRPEAPREWARWFWTVESGPVMVVRELLSSAVFVLAVGLLLFAISGVWPPMVAVQSGSMEPHMHRGDLVFIVEEHRFAGQGAVEGTGVVTYRAGLEDDYEKFGGTGDVIVYRPDGSDRRDPIIHRTRFWVEEGENWYDKADPDHVQADNCGELTYCPAPNSGFVTKGDNPRTNRFYDQANRMSRPVKPEWIEGKAMVRVPWLGYVRLNVGSVAVGIRELTRGFSVAAGVAVASTQLIRR